MLLRRKCTARLFLQMLPDTAGTAGLIYVMVIGASVFNYFITVGRFPQELIQLIDASGLPPLTIIALILVAYIVLGAFFDRVLGL